MAGATAGATSLLELVKLLERQRPAQQFDGVTRQVDFHDHMLRFRKAVDLPGLPAAWKLAEMREWFAGVARIHISRYLRRDDAEEAFQEAVERLESEFGHMNTNAEDMLADAMSEGMLDCKDAKGINMFVCKLEEVYCLAVETDRDIDFNRTSLFKRILSYNLPHLKFGWASHIEKKELRKPTFEDFLVFLSLQRKIAMRCAELDEVIASPVEGGAMMAWTAPCANQGEITKSYAAAVAAPPQMRQWSLARPAVESLATSETEREERVEMERRQGGPPPCPLCKQNNHFLLQEDEKVAVDSQMAGADKDSA